MSCLSLDNMKKLFLFQAGGSQRQDSLYKCRSSRVFIVKMYSRYSGKLNKGKEKERKKRG